MIKKATAVAAMLTLWRFVVNQWIIQECLKKTDKTRKTYYLNLALQAGNGRSVAGALPGQRGMRGPLFWPRSEAASHAPGWDVAPPALRGLEGSQPGAWGPASVQQHQKAGHHPEWLWTQTGKTSSFCQNLQQKPGLFQLKTWLTFSQDTDANLLINPLIRIQPDSEEGSSAQLCFPPLNVATLNYPNRTLLPGFCSTSSEKIYTKVIYITDTVTSRILINADQ